MGLDDDESLQIGGTSVASAQQIKKVAGILKADPSRKLSLFQLLAKDLKTM